MDDLLTFKSIERDIFEINNKKIGRIGNLIFQNIFDLWTFLPIENFYYKPVHIAIILKQLNFLNGYDKKKEHDEKKQK